MGIILIFAGTILFGAIIWHIAYIAETGDKDAQPPKWL
jgi:hypothetical protein